jgi:hypothetical protein
MACFKHVDDGFSEIRIMMPINWLLSSMFTGVVVRSVLSLSRLRWVPDYRRHLHSGLLSVEVWPQIILKT